VKGKHGVQIITHPYQIEMGELKVFILIRSVFENNQINVWPQIIHTYFYVQMLSTFIERSELKIIF